MPPSSASNDRTACLSFVSSKAIELYDAQIASAPDSRFNIKPHLTVRRMGSILATGRLFVTGGYPPVLFELVKIRLYSVTILVQIRIDMSALKPTFFSGYNYLDVCFLQGIDQ